MNASNTLEILAETAAADFKSRLGRSPRWVVAAPGRVNLIGEHTDYNDGFVLPMAIDRHVVVAGDRPRTAGPPVARVVSAARGAEAVMPLDGVLQPVPGDWSNYVRGVLAGFRARGL